MSNIYIKIKKNVKAGTLLQKLFSHATMPFLIQPRVVQQPSGTYATSHLKKGELYHQAFEKRPGRKIIWEFEQTILRSIISQFKPIDLHLDFAGGTGRIAEVLEPYVNNQIILDISPQMVAVAANRLKKTSIINKDFRDLTGEIPDDSVAITTAFRFFANAESKLRSGAINFIAKKLEKGGLLICNNHRNFWSVSYILSRFTLRGGDVGMINNELIRMAEDVGLSLVATYSLGVIPQSESNSLLPWRIVRILEGFILRVSGTKQRLGYNVIFVFKKT